VRRACVSTRRSFLFAFCLLPFALKKMPEIPAPPPARLLLELPNIVDRLDLSQLFPRVQPVEVELGSGDGTFLVDYAVRHPQINLIGVERFLGRARKMERKGRRAGLANLRCVRLEASYFLEYLLPPNSLQAIHVYFPDPWPKRRHHKNRLINEHFVQMVRQALLPDGVVRLRTDDANYFAQMRALFAASPFFQETETPPALAALVTDFERDFNQKGVPTLRAAYKAA
jgi:tRNA (guanine-N7-)-methyltransferase